jgi:hypothetical protein
VANLLYINFCTFIESHRFKSLSAIGEFAATDMLDSTNPGAGELIQAGGVQQRPNVGGARVYSFYGLKSEIWKSTLSDGRSFKEVFQKWIESALSTPAHCVYMTGHHWAGGSVYTTLSWGEDTSHFHVRFDTDKSKLYFGVERDRIEIDTANLRAECKIVFGFGCNVCTGANSTKYQNFFSPSKPVTCGWTESVTVPREESKSVNKRFFAYLDTYYAGATNVPNADRVIWLYDNDPMQLVKAWGWATKNFYQSQARARDKGGTLYKFKVNAKGWPEPVKA